MRSAGLILLLCALRVGPVAAQSTDETETEAASSASVNARRIVIIRRYTAGAAGVAPAAAQVAAPAEPETLPLPKPVDAAPAASSEAMTAAETEELFIEEVDQPERYWISASHLLWWIKAIDLPPLVTTGPTTDPRPGSLDSMFTSIRFGGQDIEPHERHGGRFFAGCWFDPEHRYALELGGFFLAYRNISFLQSSPGAPVVARPFYDVINDEPSASIVTYPGLSLGSISVTAGTAMHGVESSFRWAVWDDGLLGFDVLGGFRYVDLEEDLRIQENLTVLRPDDPMAPLPPFVDQSITVRDAFETQNDFFGGQIGLRVRYQLRRLELRLGGKVALGDTYQTVRIAGDTTIGNGPAQNGGLLALPSNIGRFSRHTFAVIPEANAEFSFQVCKRFRIFAGYSFLYWSDIVRPGDQIDLAVNVNQLPTNADPGVGGPSRPRFEFRETDFWAQGANFGVEFRY